MSPYTDTAARRKRRPRRRPGENRAALLEAATIEFGKHGFHGASTAAIAARAEVPQPHVYVHFDTKDDLFFAALEHAYAAADSVPDGTSEERLARLRQIEYLMHLQAITAMAQEFLQERLSEMIGDHVRKRGVSWHLCSLESAAQLLMNTTLPGE